MATKTSKQCVLWQWIRRIFTPWLDREKIYAIKLAAQEASTKAYEASATVWQMKSHKMEIGKEFHAMRHEFYKREFYKVASEQNNPESGQTDPGVLAMQHLAKLSQQFIDITKNQNNELSLAAVFDLHKDLIESKTIMHALRFRVYGSLDTALLTVLQCSEKHEAILNQMPDVTATLDTLREHIISAGANVIKVLQRHSSLKEKQPEQIKLIRPDTVVEKQKLSAEQLTQLQRAMNSLHKITDALPDKNPDFSKKEQRNELNQAIFRQLKAGHYDSVLESLIKYINLLPYGNHSPEMHVHVNAIFTILLKAGANPAMAVTPSNIYDTTLDLFKNSLFVPIIEHTHAGHMDAVAQALGDYRSKSKKAFVRTFNKHYGQKLLTISVKADEWENVTLATNTPQEIVTIWERQRGLLDQYQA